MTSKASPAKIKEGFESKPLRLLLSKIVPSRPVKSATFATVKFAQILASVREIGVIEPLIVYRSDEGYTLLDGHLRAAALQQLGQVDAVCLVALDDESFTYNKFISRLATLQEHAMILRAIEKGVPEDRIAKALNIDIKTLRKKEALTKGICVEALNLLKDKQIPTKTFYFLKRMIPMRQIEVAELMVAMNHFAASVAEAMLMATPDEKIIESERRGPVKGITDTQKAMMERESENLDREFRSAEKDYGVDHLDLVIITGYITRLLSNERIVKYLGQHHSEICSEFQRLAMQKAS